MKRKKLLATLLSITVCLGCFASVVVVPAVSAEQQGDPVVTFRSPAILADVGEVIDLTRYSVEFAEGVPSNGVLTWTQNSTAVTSFTPSAAGVTTLVAQNGAGASKNVYVVAKAASDTEYALYRNDFNTAADANDLTVVEGSATMTVQDGALELVSTNTGSSDDNYIRLPAWLGEFGNYRMEIGAATRKYLVSGAANVHIGFYCRGLNTTSAKSAYTTRLKHTAADGEAFTYGYRDATGNMPARIFGSHKSLYSLEGSSPAKAPHTYVLTAHDDVIAFELDGETILYDDGEKAEGTYVGQLGFMAGRISLSVDYITVAIDQPVKAPVSATFTPDADLEEGTISGTLSVNLNTTSAQPLDVVYYWGNGEGKLPGYASFDKILVPEGASNVSKTIPAGTVVPSGATELLVYTSAYNGESDSYVRVALPQTVQSKDLGAKVSEFQIASDMHIMSTDNQYAQWNEQHFVTLLNSIAQNSPDSLGLFIGGDIVDGGKQAEYNKFKQIVSTYGNGIRLEGVIGNHEYWNTNTYADIMNPFLDAMDIAEATADKPYYSQTINGVHFFFLNSTVKEGTGQGHNKSTIGEAQRTWLDTGLAAAAEAGGPMLVFHHQKMNEITDASSLKAILKKYPEAIFVTSHSHEDMNQDGGIFEFATTSMCNTVNTASVSFIISDHYNSSTEYDERRRIASQAYYVEVYNDTTLFRGIDVLSGEWLPSAQFAFDYTPANDQPDVPLLPEDPQVTQYPKVVDVRINKKQTSENTAFLQALDEYFDVYGTDSFDDNHKMPSTTGNAPDKAFDWGPESPSEKMTTAYSGGTGWLTFKLNKDMNSAAATISNDMQALTYKRDVNNFKAEFNLINCYEAVDDKHSGIVIGGQKGAFPLVYGPDFSDDTGVYITMTVSGNLIIAGAIADQDALSPADKLRVQNNGHTIYGSLTSDGKPMTGTNMMYVQLRARSGTNGVVEEDQSVVPVEKTWTTANYTSSSSGIAAKGGYALVVQVQDGILKVWAQGYGPDDAEDRSFTIPLSEKFVPGQLSYVTSQFKNTGFSGFKITEYASNEVITRPIVNGKTPVTVNMKDGYELKAGSLWATDAYGNMYVAQRAGFRTHNDVKASYYFDTAAELNIRSEFMMPTTDEANLGIVGTSVKTANSGLRFVSRFSCFNEDGAYYVNLGGTAYAVEKMGMLISTARGLKNLGVDEPTLEVAQQMKDVCAYDVQNGGTGKYYDVCANYVDVSACVTGLTTGALKEEKIVARGYMVVNIDGESKVFYTDAFTTTYNRSK